MKLKKEEVFVIKASDFESLIEKTYGQQYDYNEDQDIQKGDFKKYEIKSLSMKSHQKEYLQNFLADGELGGSTSALESLCGALLIDLIKKGILPKGTYFIESHDY